MKCILVFYHWKQKESMLWEFDDSCLFIFEALWLYLRYLSLSIKKYRHSATPDLNLCWLPSAHALVPECPWLAFGLSSTRTQTLIDTISLKSEIASVPLYLNTLIIIIQISQQRTPPHTHQKCWKVVLWDESSGKVWQPVHEGVHCFYSTGLASIG